MFLSFNWNNKPCYLLQSRDDFHNSKNLITGHFFSITHPFDKFKGNLWFFYLFGQIWTMVQMYRSWLNKVDVLTSLTAFTHEMTSIIQKNLIVDYFFSIAQPFDKFKENFWIFYLFGQISTMYNCTYHDSIRWSCWSPLEVLTSLWSPS